VSMIINLLSTLLYTVNYYIVTPTANHYAIKLGTDGAFGATLVSRKTSVIRMKQESSPSESATDQEEGVVLMGPIWFQDLRPERWFLQTTVQKL
jgi:hypothetical protein